MRERSQVESKGAEGRSHLAPSRCMMMPSALTCFEILTTSSWGKTWPFKVFCGWISNVRWMSLPSFSSAASPTSAHGPRERRPSSGRCGCSRPGRGSARRPRSNASGDRCSGGQLSEESDGVLVSRLRGVEKIGWQRRTLRSGLRVHRDTSSLHGVDMGRVVAPEG